MAKSKGMPLGTFQLYSSEKQCEDHLVALRWKDGYVCPKCGCHHANRLSNGRYQCTQCRHQVSVTAGTVLHKTHMPLRQWFLAFYFVCQDKRGISAKQLQLILGTTYKTAWYMLVRIRAAMGQRNQTHPLSGIIEFDDMYFGGPTIGKKRGRGTEKAKVFVAMSLDERGNPRFLKMQETPNIKQVSVKKFANAAFTPGSGIHSDGYRSYIPALKGFVHKHKVYDPQSLLNDGETSIPLDRVSTGSDQQRLFPGIGSFDNSLTFPAPNSTFVGRFHVYMIDSSSHLIINLIDLRKYQ